MKKMFVSDRDGEQREIFFNFFFSRLSLRYMEIGSSEFVGPRKQNALLDEGYT